MRYIDIANWLRISTDNKLKMMTQIYGMMTKVSTCLRKLVYYIFWWINMHLLQKMEDRLKKVGGSTAICAAAYAFYIGLWCIARGLWKGQQYGHVLFWVFFSLAVALSIVGLVLCLISIHCLARPMTSRVHPDPAAAAHPGGADADQDAEIGIPANDGQWSAFILKKKCSSSVAVFIKFSFLFTSIVILVIKWIFHFHFLLSWLDVWLFNI